jgi:AraC family transcriptional regulator
MMLCHSFDPHAFTNGSAFADRNRITRSAVTDFAMDGYAAPTYSIKYVLGGTEHYRIDGRHFALGSGRFLVVNKDQPIDFEVRSARKVTGLCIHLRSDLLTDVARQRHASLADLLDTPLEEGSIQPFAPITHGSGAGALGDCVSDFASRIDGMTGFVDVCGQGIYYRLADGLVRMQAPGLRDISDVGRRSTRVELQRRLSIAREFIEACGDQALDIGTIARHALLSPAHLFRSFKIAYGLSPYQYHQNRRLDRAAVLLREETMSASEIALEAGFADLASFSKAFKKRYGCAPTKWQR